MISLANETVQQQLETLEAEQETSQTDRFPAPSSPALDWKKMCKISKLRPLRTEDFLNVIDEAMFEKAQELVF